MTKLVITQTKENNTKETVSNSVITALYNIGKDDDNNQTFTSGVDTTDVNRPITSVSGAILVSAAYANQIDYLQNKYPNLDITATSIYIAFADQNVENVLKTKLASQMSNAGVTAITASIAANANIGEWFKNNTSITSFDEFPYFTQNNMYGGSPFTFEGCTNLESIDLSQCRQLWAKSNHADNTWQGTFWNTKLSTVTLNDNITEIPHGCFDTCRYLTSINIPSACTKLGHICFKFCSNLSIDVADLINIEHIGRAVFTRRSADISAMLTGDENGIVYLPNLQTIGAQAFRENPYLKEINFPNLTDLNVDMTFNGCSNLQKITSLGNITMSQIGNNYFATFGSCTNLREVSLPAGVTALQQGMFSSCTSLSTINLDNIVYIGGGAFQNCNSLKIANFKNAITAGNSFITGNSNAHVYLPKLTSTSVVTEADPWGSPKYTTFCRQNANSTLNTLYFKDIQSFGAGTFCRLYLTTLIINNSTVPTITPISSNLTLSSSYNDINSDLFCGVPVVQGQEVIPDVYVPDASLSAYQSSQIFAKAAQANKIHGISELTQITIDQAKAGNTGIIAEYM